VQRQSRQRTTVKQSEEIYSCEEFIAHVPAGPSGDSGIGYGYIVDINPCEWYGTRAWARSALWEQWVLLDFEVKFISTTDHTKSGNVTIAFDRDSNDIAPQDYGTLTRQAAVSTTWVGKDAKLRKPKYRDDHIPRWCDLTANVGGSRVTDYGQIIVYVDSNDMAGSNVGLLYFKYKLKFMIPDMVADSNLKRIGQPIDKTMTFSTGSDTDPVVATMAGTLLADGDVVEVRANGASVALTGGVAGYFDKIWAGAKLFARVIDAATQAVQLYATASKLVSGQPITWTSAYSAGQTLAVKLQQVSVDQDEL